jgi:hypothetical protein
MDEPFAERDKHEPETGTICPDCVESLKALGLRGPNSMTSAAAASR